MSSLSRELVFLILQFLDEEKFKETVHKLEQESAFFFNMKYFEDQVQAGAWEEVERYLSGFTKVDDNRYSMKIFFEIRKQKYLEALDKNDRAKAVEILVKDLKVFASFNEDLYKEITQLLTLENFRENEQLSKYGDTKSARHIMLLELKKLIEANPLFREKLSFPLLKASRLRTLINQSLNWQHQLCKNPRSNPDIKTLFVDHTCGPPNGARPPPPANGALVGSIPKPGAFPPLGGHGPYAAGAPPAPGPIAGWMGNPNVPTVVGTPAMAPASNAGSRPPKTPPTLEYQSADSEAPPLKKVRLNDEVSFSGQNIPHSIEDIPKTVARTITQGSCVLTLEFHPLQQAVLLVGTNVGEIAIWEVATREKLASRSFKVWDLPACSMQLQTALVKDPAVLANRVVWSPDGALLGVAFSKHIIQIYQYYGIGELRQHIELDAHVGNVNDLAFAHPDKQLCIISCGEDKTIKVWEAATGRKIYTFEGHEAPVYSVCPHHKEAIQFIFSTAMDGKIKAWLYDGRGSRVDYDAPGNWCTSMAYSADGTRLFSCGSSKDGDSHLVEWNETEGTIKRTYLGFRKRIQCVAAFDTTRNCFLAVGDDFAIKFWDMDNVNMLTSVDAEGGLPACPRLRFNKEGSLLAVTTMDNGFKILANADGLRLLRSGEVVANVEPVKQAGPIVTTSAIAPIMEIYRPMAGPRPGEEPISRLWKMLDIMEPIYLRCIKLPDTLPASKVSRLLFTSPGGALLALASNAVHKLWKWPRNPLGRATTNVTPSLWQPVSGMLMTNDIGGANPEEAEACLALSKNDSYVVSSSGGKVSLFNMMTFKVMTMFLPPPPAVSFLAFHPMDNNIIAIGLEDSTIQIYNVRVDEVKCRLKGHQKRITGLAFSTTQQLMVSCGADDQLILWRTEGWQKLGTKMLQLPPGRGATGPKLQFHNDQTRLLVVHETLLAVYDTPKLERIRQWGASEMFPSSISSAAYSCCGKSLYVAFVDGLIGVFEAETLRPFSRIHPSAYLAQGVTGVYPLVITAHPSEPTLIAVGLTDGAVLVLEPLEQEGKWGSVAPLDMASVNSAAIIPAAAAAGATGPSSSSSLTAVTAASLPLPAPTGAATTAAGGSSDQASR